MKSKMKDIREKDSKTLIDELKDKKGILKDHRFGVNPDMRSKTNEPKKLKKEVARICTHLRYLKKNEVKNQIKEES